jgi:16S rRNA (guanine1207-N2)-methyltransferase
MLDRERDKPHYFSKKQPPAKRNFKLNMELKGYRIELNSCSGIFSKDKIDNGTMLLAASMELPEEGTLLDLGCGCGAVGIAAARMKPRLKVTMVDINPVAVRLTRGNIEANGLENAEVLESDLYSNLEGRYFDAIVSNPPLAAGYKVIFPLIEGAGTHLSKGGSLQLVLRKGVKAIPAKMTEVFGNVETISKKSGYRVFRSRKV